MHLISNLERINIKMLNKDKFYSIIHLLIEKEPCIAPTISNFLKEKEWEQMWFL